MNDKKKPDLAVIPGGQSTTQSQRPALELFLAEVVDLLNDWRLWTPSVARRGVMTPGQLLALILWSVQTSETSEADDLLIIERWSRALMDSVCGGVVVALHPISLLPLESGDPKDKWVLTVAHANAFLEWTPIGFDVEKALTHWAKEAERLGAEQTTPNHPDEVQDWSGLVAYRKSKKTSGTRSVAWPEQHIGIARAELERRGGTAASRHEMATELGVTRQALAKKLKIGEKKGPDKAVWHHALLNSSRA